MNCWTQSRGVEAEGWAVLKPYIDERTDGRYVLTGKGTLARWLQESAGDVITNTQDGRMWTIELKTERKWTGNLFLETWSNRNLDNRNNHGNAGSNPGWLAKLRADLLLYYFLDADVLVSIDLFQLKRWAFGYVENDDVINGNLYRHRWDASANACVPVFRERRQGVYVQANDTWGRIVPIGVIHQEIGARYVLRTRVKQRALIEERGALEVGQ